MSKIFELKDYKGDFLSMINDIVINCAGNIYELEDYDEKKLKDYYYFLTDNERMEIDGIFSLDDEFMSKFQYYIINKCLDDNKCFHDEEKNKCDKCDDDYFLF